jgi:para-aminobenzoate synthetase/4-amino-4-deoxychorismate lyase
MVRHHVKQQAVALAGPDPAQAARRTFAKRARSRKIDSIDLLDVPDLKNALARPGTVLLDTARPDAENQRSLLFTEPERILRAERPGDVSALLDAVDEAAAAGHHLAGYVGYEAGYSFVERPGAATNDAPLAWLGVYDAPHVLDPDAADAFFAEYDATRAKPQNARFAIERDAYTKRIRQIKRHIRAGDVYQINFTDHVGFDFAGDPVALYARLRKQQRVPFGAFLNTGPRRILSLSPELFFRREGRRVTTRPMKGTTRRGRTLAEDEALREELAADEKSRAENLMIVDLLRNDLSVACEPGSVQVPALFETERYESVIQMTSTVEGRLRENTSYADIFRALFPCGSVTGAPKRRAMRLLRRLERGPRGVYCGAIGHIAPDDTACFSVAIRTVVLEDDGGGRMGTGSGIVWDSDARSEYDECALKARFLTEAPRDFRLIETMRCEDGAIRHRALHLNRLRDSAHYFGFELDEKRLRRRINEAISNLSAKSAMVRLTLGRHGDAEVTTGALPERLDRPYRLTIAEQRVDSENVLLYHKTTRRGVYERAYREAQAGGFDEALLLNERGEVTEGTRTSVFVRDGDEWRTPPVSSGLLAGTEREHLLRTLPNAEEADLRPEDLRAADALYVCNALRGLCRAKLTY